MINKGANPYVVAHHGLNQIGVFNIQESSLSNLPTQKSVYFTIRPIVGEFEEKTNFPNPWFYRTGVFDGEFSSMIGQGASGSVLRGQWYGKKAAFKFVEIRNQEFQSNVSDAVLTLNKKLSEMTSIQATKGSKIVSFYGHYR